MWIARDKDKYLGLFYHKPVRGDDESWYCSGGDFEDHATGPITMELPSSWYPDLTWEDEPREVSIVPC